MRVATFLQKQGGTAWAKTHYERYIEPNKAEILAVRDAFERMRRSYGLRFSEADYVGYYGIDIKKREVIGLYPGSFSELTFLMLHASVIIFADPDMSGVTDWLGLMPNHFYQVHRQEWDRWVGSIRGRF